MELAKAEEQARARAEAIAKAGTPQNERGSADALAKTTDNARTAAERIDTSPKLPTRRPFDLNTRLSEVGTNLKTVGEGLAGVGEDKLRHRRGFGVKDTVAGVREEVQTSASP